jgi:type I restriction enzyme S subunit
MMEEDAVPNIDINPNDWVEIRRILRTCVPEYEVWAFGSRAKWTAKPYSDLDLAILTDKPLSLQKAAELRSTLDESTIPIKVDFVDWAATSESFRKIIEAGKVVALRPATGLSGWTFKRLIDCTVDGVLSYGIVQPGQHDERGVPIVRVNNISTGQLHIDEPLRVASEIEANYQRTRLEGGEVLLTVVGTTGQSAIVPKELAGWNVARAVAVIRPKPDIGARWIHICLQSKAVQQFLDERANTTVQKTLNLSDIKEVLIPIPPPGVKEMIESTAVGLDDKIELNRRMNATLEAMARALFQSWFVDFDPVRAKLDGRTPAAVDPTTAALFPASFQDSTLGAIPHGWTATTLGDACKQGGGNIQTGPFGTQLHASDYVIEGIPSIMPSDLRDNRIDTSSIACIREQDAERLKVYRVQTGDVVYSRRGDVERRSLIRRGEHGWLCGTGCLRVRFGPLGLNPFFGASHLGTLESRAWVVRHAVGATMPNLNTSILGALPMIVPPVELQARFAEIVGPWDERGTIALEQSRTLATLRDTLLPKLLSGELSVARVESDISA